MKRLRRPSIGKFIVAVIGGSSCSAEVERNAHELGYLLAKVGATVVCGGLGGVMEAVAKGVKSANGVSIGILPGNDKRDANPYITLPLPTGIGFARNTLVVGCADIVIALRGKYGTLSEIAFALNMGKPVIGMGSWNIEGLIKADSPKEAIKKVKVLSTSLNKIGEGKRG